MIKINHDTFCDLTTELAKLYFPSVKYLMDAPKGMKAKYAVELFNNGCSTYAQFINTLSKNCNETKEAMHKLVSKHIEDFDGYKYKPT